MTTDLFPETLLVSRSGDRIYTTSLKVAEFFHKRHDTVLRAIRTIVEATQDEVSLRNFAARDYIDGRGKVQPLYELTHDGFAVAVMSFTGQEALEWKWKFLAAFRTQERALVQLTARYAHAFDQVRPNVRPAAEDCELGISRAATAGRLGKSTAAVTYHRRQARRFGLL